MRTHNSAPLVATYDYNDAGDLMEIVYSDDTPAVSHTYDRLGRPLTTTDAAGLLTRSYDPASFRLSGEAYTGAGVLSGRGIARTYDLKHRPQSLATDGGYGLGYSYDKAGRLEIINQGFHSAHFGYEAGTSLHKRTTVKRVGVERVRHDRNFDRIGRIESVTSTVGGIATVARTYGYNDANQRVGVAHENGRRWAYDYDDLGQVRSAQKRLADNTTPLPGYTFGYAFDDIGNRTETTANGRTATYNPDLLNRYFDRVVPGAFDVRGEANIDSSILVTVDTLSTIRTGRDFYRELAAPNGSAAVRHEIEIEATRISPPESVGETRSAFLPQTPEEFKHDDDGNLEQDGRWDYEWDAENRLVGMETRASIAIAFPELKKRLTFVYDAQGRRIRKTVESWDVSLNTGAGGWVETLDLLFLYDGWNLLTELDANNSNALVRSHAWGLDLSGSTQGAGGVGGLLWTSTPTHSFAACADGNGNIVAWINTATLAVSGRADYGAFGEVVQSTGVANTLPFGFSTKYTDKETGLLCYGFRYYNPSTGRWLSRDPIEEQGGFNVYRMVGNDPVNRWDLFGLAPGDDYETLEAAELAAAKDAWDATNRTILLGEKEYADSPYAPPHSGKYYTVYTGFGSNDVRWIYGIEHGAGVYCIKKDGKTVFSYGELVEGDAATREEVIRGSGGSVDLDKALKIHTKHSAYSKSLTWHTGVHSHNMKQVPYNWPGDEFSHGDRLWARKRGLAIILVADSGMVRKYKHSLQGSPKNGVEIGNVCGCEKESK